MLRGGVTYSQPFHWLGARGVPASRPLGEGQTPGVGRWGKHDRGPFIYLSNFWMWGVLVLLLQLTRLGHVHALPVEEV